MASIPSRSTKLELIVRKYLFAHGFRYRINVKRLPGHPDIVLRKYRTVILVNGCFWHGHENCTNFRKSQSNVVFWEMKIKRNKQRDAEQYIKLRTMGWHVIQIWECQLKKDKRDQTLKSLIFTLNRIYLQDLGHFKSYQDPFRDESESMKVAEDILPYQKKS